MFGIRPNTIDMRDQAFWNIDYVSGIPCVTARIDRQLLLQYEDVSMLQLNAQLEYFVFYYINGCSIKVFY